VRTAILSDIHGNLAALEAVLADLGAAGVNRAVCLGDVAATGPQPHQVIQRLQALNAPTVMGNTDEWLLNPQPTPDADADTKRHEAIDAWCVTQLDSTDLEYLRTFCPTVEVGLGGGYSLLAYHGSPRSYNEQILPMLSEDELKDALSGFHASVMAGGHTHWQMMRHFEDMLVMNPGSIGLPYEKVGDAVRNPSWAEYAILDADTGYLRVELRRVSYDVRPTLEAAKASGMPHADWWTQDWDVS
jgi:predicted phosphodiesterase